MIPPQEIDVLDSNRGFTAITPSMRYRWENGRYVVRMTEGNTLWRPSFIAPKGTVGKLVEYKTNSFYQTNNDVTQAIYKIPGYRYRVAVWFDNRTGERIA